MGCGQGYFSRLLARAGARVTGIDISEKLIAHATRRQLDVPLGIQYLVMDAAKLAESVRSNTFDLVASCIALQDMAEPLNVLRGMRHVLRNAGRAVILVEHPTNTTAYREWETNGNGRKIALRIDRYFDTGPREVVWKFKRQTGEKQSYPFPAWGHTLEEWSLMISSSDFTIGRLLEPRPTREQVDRVPQLDDCFRIPYFLIFDLVSDKR